jgi:hypothetical protein
MMLLPPRYSRNTLQPAMVHVSLPRGFSAFGKGWYAMSSAWAIGFGVSPMLQECKGKKKGLSEMV